MSTRTYADGRLVEWWDDDARVYWHAETGARVYTADEAAPLVAAEAVVACESNRRTIEDIARLALAANISDVTQDEAVITQATAIATSPATNLTTQQIVGVLKDLAQGLVILAEHDITVRKELQALIRLAVGDLDSLEGT